MRGDPLSGDARAFIAASLEHEAQWARALQDARCAAGAYPPLSLLWPGAVLEDAARGSSLFLIWRAAKSVSADPYNKPSWGFLNAREDGVKGEPNEGVSKRLGF